MRAGVGRRARAPTMTDATSEPRVVTIITVGTERNLADVVH
jgi:hypothetical protein